ncbi:MAG: hypothetical protein ACOCSD_04145 [Halolamina sp.]
MSPIAAQNFLLFGLLAVGIGGALYRFARPLARFNEQIDAIGSTTPTEEVEPAVWKVVLYRLFALLFTVSGVLLVGRGLFGYL